MSERLSAGDYAEQAGFDLSLIDANLRCTFEQRALKHQIALDLALELSRAGERLRDRPQLTAEAPVRS